MFDLERFHVRLGRSIFWWLALTLSALVLGGSALLLLKRERAHLRSAWRETEEGKIQIVADRLTSTVMLVQDELGTALANGAWENLDGLEQTNPMVRNVFVFDPQTRNLRRPLAVAPATNEERGFLRRYETTVFADRGLWLAAFASSAATNDLHVPNLRRAAYHGPQGEVRAFWLPWTSDNYLHMLGGIQFEPNGAVYGVEVEMVSLIARLSLTRPAAETASLWRSGRTAYDSPAIALLDGSGRILASAGDVPGSLAVPPDFLYPLGDVLPHWQMGVYPSADITREGRTLGRIATWLIVVMVVAILSGGAALLADARRSRREARQRTTFVANVSHELKTPLTSIRMYAELLRDGRVSDDERRQRFLDTMVQEGERLTRLIDNVLDFGRLEQERRRYRPRPVDLADELRAVLEVERPRLTGVGIELTTDLPEHLPLVTDPDAVRQIVLNLLDNAAKYAADGRVVHVSLGSADGKVRLAVQDAGPGIPPAARERIFRMFERLDNSLEAKAGSGLGLAIARGLACGLGGDLTCCSRADGPGACFVLSLPANLSPEEEIL